MTVKIPMLLRRNERIAKFGVSILDIPIRLIPISSEKGEAMRNAPATGSDQI